MGTYEVIYSNDFEEKFQHKEIGELTKKEAIAILSEYRAKYKLAFLKLINQNEKGEK